MFAHAIEFSGLFFRCHGWVSPNILLNSLNFPFFGDYSQHLVFAHNAVIKIIHMCHAHMSILIAANLLDGGPAHISLAVLAEIAFDVATVCPPGAVSLQLDLDLSAGTEIHARGLVANSIHCGHAALFPRSSR